MMALYPKSIATPSSPPVVVIRAYEGGASPSTSHWCLLRSGSHRFRRPSCFQVVKVAGIWSANTV